MYQDGGGRDPLRRIHLPTTHEVIPVADQNGNLQSVIDRMNAIQTDLHADPGDGVARFNSLYLAVTQAVDASLQARKFQRPDFVANLATNFAGFYFAAYDAAGNGVPEAWRLLFKKRDAAGIAPIQFAIAGMNAHINHDLALALVETWETLGRKPSHHSPEYADYEGVNGILAQVEEQVKPLLETARLEAVDGALGKLDDAVAIWSVARARDAAWTTAEVLWTVRDQPAAGKAISGIFAGLVDLSGHGLLR
jgi:hypothetical protein